MKKSVIITGCNGGIGECLAQAFYQAGWFVIGIDRVGQASKNIDAVFNLDISDFVSDEEALAALASDVRALTQEKPISTLINNAAVQHLGSLQKLTPAQIIESMNVNVVAPMLLAKEFLSDLIAAKGSIVNIGSVHAQATKPDFAAYATSKTALHGMTRALAVDLGPDVRVNTVAPAATATKMLEAGFEGNELGFKALQDVHPLQRIAAPEEIANIALFLASEQASFLTGTTIYADGGILSRLHDPA
ncbi:MAG: SDR family oxidoreductase [Hyphomonadaceae bacterium]|nr:SDR family oxidoreductase [Hyphomonadaceae bacterium]